MRVFKTHAEALDEITRDLGERGTRVHPETMQDKDISDSPDYDTCELTDYTYCVLDSQDFAGLEPTQPWADLEFGERVSGEMINPGEAWHAREELWEEYLEPHLGLFAYTYPERYLRQPHAIAAELLKHPHSRQLFLGMWEPTTDTLRFGRRRVPCSLGYQFLYRDGLLHITYFQRSADFANHFRNDVYLACRLLAWVAERAGMTPGRFTHHITSLHVYQKDVRGVF
jgi:hypothetical protein